MARAVKSKVRRGVKLAKAISKKSVAKPARIKKTVTKVAAIKSGTKIMKKVSVEVASSEAAKKKLSEKFLATIEKRKAEQDKKPAFSKPRGRRGRRPKNLTDYQPYSEEQEDDQYSYQSENENLEYDTGIRVQNAPQTGIAFRDDGLVTLDRVEDFDEELNFDW
ncbi:MAG: hypothetical protein EB120_04415 [Proteobacteria bacterium]|nr:hypothetical protein [Pseudomonadota bacterium]NDC24014.1 hypothetical protein [Pseudomonadota bacterium]NDG26406.1 hypothetical protein [Pseudomonadota bacterium]